jgi:hypothetical protein
MERDGWFRRPVFYIGMVLYFLLGFSTLGWGARWAEILYPEDHYFENVGAISLFAAAGICLFAFVRAYQNRKKLGIGWIKLLVYLGLAALFFFGGGEEISWGQRIFHIQEPATLAQENLQGELNVHNLAFIDKNKFLKADNLFSVFWMAFAVAIPALGLLSRPFKNWVEKLTPVAHWGLGALFLINYFLAKAVKPFFGTSYSYSVITFPQAVQEVKESNYELLFAVLSLMLLWQLLHALQGSNLRQASAAGNSDVQNSRVRAGQH